MAHSKQAQYLAGGVYVPRTVLAKSAWNSTSARLSRDSFLPFASCKLCLLPARSPVSCSHGDIFCRECALSNILAQKKEIKRLEKTREREDKEAEEDRSHEEDAARERAVHEFEKIQMGLEAKIGGIGKKLVGRQDDKTVIEGVAGSRTGEKRKFALDEDEVLRIAHEDRNKARKAIDDEKASKTTLPSFWVPSITPSSNTHSTLHTITKKEKPSPVCPQSPDDKPHYYSLRTLITVAFTEEKDAATKLTQRICPSCKKVLSNTSKAMLAIPCGHVLCKSCVTRFMTPSGVCDPHAPHTDQNMVHCYVCNENLTEKGSNVKLGKDATKSDKDKDKVKPGLVEIKSEGTGFASGGSNTVEKSGVAFQC